MVLVDYYSLIERIQKNKSYKRLNEILYVFYVGKELGEELPSLKAGEFLYNVRDKARKVKVPLFGSRRECMYEADKLL